MTFYYKKEGNQHRDWKAAFLRQTTSVAISPAHKKEINAVIVKNLTRRQKTQVEIMEQQEDILSECNERALQVDPKIDFTEEEGHCKHAEHNPSLVLEKSVGALKTIIEVLRDMKDEVKELKQEKRPLTDINLAANFKSEIFSLDLDLDSEPKSPSEKINGRSPD